MAIRRSSIPRGQLLGDANNPRQKAAPFGLKSSIPENDCRKMNDAEAFALCRKKGAKYKAKLKSLGYTLEFYEFIDSYKERFDYEVKKAITEHASLVAVAEMPEPEFKSPNWEEYHLNPADVINIDTGAEYEQYAQADIDVNAPFIGATRYFHDGEGFKSIIRIQEDIVFRKCPGQEYMLKLCTLFHELGHVTDAEKGKNIDLREGRIAAVSAEAFANDYAMNCLAERQMFRLYGVFVATMRTHSQGTGFLAEVARETLSRHIPKSVIDWMSILHESGGL